MKSMMCGANGRECVQKEGEVTLKLQQSAFKECVQKEGQVAGACLRDFVGARVDVCAYVYRFSYALVQELVSESVFCFVREREREKGTETSMCSRGQGLHLA